MNMPLLSFGSNQVDLGGISISASATSKSSEIDVGNIENAIAISLWTLSSSSLRPLIPPIKSILLSTLGSPIPRIGVSRKS